MGKRKNNISGLSRFLAEATKLEFSVESSTVTASTSQREVHPSGTVSAVVAEHETETRSDARPTKKVKLQAGLLGEGLEKYDATGLAPFYTEASQVPEHLQKYFSQRERYFSMYASGCLLDEEGWYSVTPERVADQIAERCRCGVILDAFCGVGGNAIAFARTCERVIAMDISPIRLALARHNAALYGVQDRIEFILGDFLSFARTLQNSSQRRKIDVVFLSPPWGGPSYIAGSPSKPQAAASAPALPPSSDDAKGVHAEFSLSSVGPIHGRELFHVARRITKNIAYFLPRNTNLDEISQLVAEDSGYGTNGALPAEKVEVEEEWMGTKLKALTCYFGGLVAGQEVMFEA
ncbi:Trimethylguanosine synthase [Trametes pubescens]|uniref:Trimethylguanosine synthase n=1 Tax=Trametes pubescens TaxID=154538 RepID=A0A1M2V626_TRAPU|nr:Trimethylguanosine synthase [Trametes pubescens]